MTRLVRMREVLLLGALILAGVWAVAWVILPIRLGRGMAMPLTLRTMAAVGVAVGGMATLEAAGTTAAVHTAGMVAGTAVAMGAVGATEARQGPGLDLSSRRTVQRCRSCE
jgi:hypothetical protein